MVVPVYLQGAFERDLVQAARALGVGYGDMLKMFTDGRCAAPFTEAWMSEELGAERVSGDKAWDLHSESLGRIEVRCLTKQVDFAPNKMRGTNRKFSLDGLIDKLTEIDHYAVVDVLEPPVYRWWVVPSQDIAQRVLSDRIKGGRVGRKRWLEKTAPSMGFLRLTGKAAIGCRRGGPRAAAGGIASLRRADAAP